MKRKLVQQAGSAFTLTLPIDWIRDRGLKAGDEIEVLPAERKLIISSSHKLATSKVEVTFVDLPRRMRYTYFAALYSRGVDELDITVEKNFFPDLSQHIGYAVTAHEEDVLQVRDLSGSANEDVDMVFKRVFQMILRTYNLAIEDMFNKQEITNDKIRSYDREVNKFCYFLQRIVMKESFTPVKGKLLFAYAYALEAIGDEISRMWQMPLHTTFKPTKDLRKVATMVGEVLDLSFALYFRFSDVDAKKMLTYKEKFRPLAAKHMGKDSSSSWLMLYLIKIFDNAYDLLHLAIMHHYRPTWVHQD